MPPPDRPSFQRRVAMLGAVVANAEAASDEAVAPLRLGLRGVQVELRELTTVLSELQDELAAAGKPRSRSNQG